MNLKPVIKRFLRSRELSGGQGILKAIVIPPVRGYCKHFRVDIGNRLVWDLQRIIFGGSKHPPRPPFFSIMSLTLIPRIGAAVTFAASASGNPWEYSYCESFNGNL